MLMITGLNHLIINFMDCLNYNRNKKKIRMDSSKQEFDCPICQQLITDAVETDCCANIFCE
jgi:hypothetical protein